MRVLTKQDIVEFKKAHKLQRVSLLTSDSPGAVYGNVVTSEGRRDSVGRLLMHELCEHCHDMIQIFIIEQGSIQMTIGGVLQPPLCVANVDFQIVHRNVPHSAVSLGPTPALVRVISIPAWQAIRVRLFQQK